MNAGYPQLAVVEEVSTERDRPWHIKARWPAVGRTTHPDWIRPAPADVYRIPRKGGLVAVEPVLGNPGTYQWRGEQSFDQDELPDEVLDAVGQVLAVLPANLRCYLVLDDREGAAGAVRLIAAGGASLVLLNDGSKATLDATTTIELGAGATHPVVLGDLLKKVETGLCDLLTTAVIPSPVGPLPLTTDATANSAQYPGSVGIAALVAAIRADIAAYLSTLVKAK